MYYRAFDRASLQSFEVSPKFDRASDRVKLIISQARVSEPLMAKGSLKVFLRPQQLNRAGTMLITG